MKRSIFTFNLAIPALVLITACSSLPKSDKETGVKETRLATNFTDQGIKVFYTLTGKLEKIEVYGQAEAWKGNVELQAEADAYAKMVKFLYGTDISQERKIKIIGRAIEKAQDQYLDRSKMIDGSIISTDREVEIEEQDRQQETKSGNKPIGGSNPGAELTKASQRAARSLNETVMETVTTLTAAGRLTAMRKVRDSVINDGKTYVATYEWDERAQATVESVRSRMNSRTTP
jgi:hypothetical protein